MADQLEEIVRTHWGRAVAIITRVTGGDLGLAEDAVQEACASALVQWSESGTPAKPLGWIVSVARRRAIDHLRREAMRDSKERLATLEQLQENDMSGSDDDDLALIFMCCHPALDPTARIALTLRYVCGVSTAGTAAGFLVSEATMAKRLVRGKAKIHQSGIRFKVPSSQDVHDRLPVVLKVIQLVFNEGYMASRRETLVRNDLCDTAINLGRSLQRLLPRQPEVAGLLAMLLLTDARRAARTDEIGAIVLLEDQDRSLWDKGKIAEGERLLETAIAMGSPGPYQLLAAIAALHSTAPDATSTDWRQIAILYGELLRYEPSPVIEANRAVAVAMSEGPAAGLVILDALQSDAQLSSWHSLHLARAALMVRLNRTSEAAAAYRVALQLEPGPAERQFILNRLRQLEIAKNPEAATNH